MWTVIIITAWLGVGVVSSGFFYAHFMRWNNYVTHVQYWVISFVSLFHLIAGPISLVACFQHMDFKRGWCLPFTDPYKNWNYGETE